jgi:hypothetical protein
MQEATERLDRVTLLVACRKLEDAEALATERLATQRERVRAAPALATRADRLTVARATRTLADILLEAGAPDRAAPHVYEARRRYRPYRDDPALSAEVSLTLAAHAFAADRSLEGEQILTEGLAAARSAPDAPLTLARLLRFSAHVWIVRMELERGDALLAEALSAAERAPRAVSAEAALVRSQHLFTQGEVAHMREDAPRARAATFAALDVAETELAAYPEYVRFARARAAHACRVFGDMDRAAELEARAEGRRG